MQKSKRIMILFRIMGFWLCVLVVISIATIVLKPKRMEFPYDNTRKECGFYAEPEDSLDLVFVGSSQLFSTVVPDVLWEEQGITSYVLGGNEQTFSISYYYIMEALKYQTPKAIVLEVSYCNWGDRPRESVIRINFDDLRWGKAKILGIANLAEPKDWEYYFLELSKYHSRWSMLSKEDFDFEGIYFAQNPYKGWSDYGSCGDPNGGFDEGPNEEVANCNDRASLNADAMEWLDKIIELCEKEDVQLILLKTPNNGTIPEFCDKGDSENIMQQVEGMAYYNELSDIADEKGIPFLNMNLIMQGNYHNNAENARKATSYLGRWIKEQIEIVDKRNDNAYAYWDYAQGA